MVSDFVDVLLLQRMQRKDFAVLTKWWGVMACLLAFLSSNAWATHPLHVVTSFYPVYVAALNVTQDVAGVEVNNLAAPHLGCLHDYQLTAGDMRHLADADIFLVNGAGMETFLEKATAQLPKLRVVEISEGIPLLDNNAHVWISFEGARQQVKNIADALARLKPEQADAFHANAEKYQQQLTALEKKLQSALAPYAGSPIVTFHEAFPYFARDFHLRLVGVIEHKPGTEPSARELADMVQVVRQQHVKALFTEPQFSDKSARVIAAETGAKIFELDPVVSGPTEPKLAREAWLTAMEKNLTVLQEALK